MGGVVGSAYALEVRAFFQTAAILTPGVLRLGPVRLQVYGLFAAAGLVAALGLSLKTARLAGLASEQIWDAGLFAVVAAFVCSRLLLIAGNFHAFLKMPGTLLALPSFTYLGMVLTGLVVVAYLRWKRLPLTRVLDAWAPCAAVLAAMLSFGKFFQGDDAGMPSSLPWAIKTPMSGGLRVHPVAMYAVIAAVLLAVGLIWLLRRGLRAGSVAGVALFAGGAAGFFVDMLTQPVEMSAGAWLDPAQWVAVGAVLVGGLMLTFSKEIA
jgi:phosphatidylglycerol:prolipoprotein diacylglycerol transferase